MSALFGSLDHLESEHRSLLWLLMVDPGEARDNPAREATARNLVARFRSEYARHAGEPAYEEFIAELHERSPRFAQWWGEHEVTDTQRGTKTLEHPTLGTLRLHHAQTVPTGAPDLRLTIYAPADAATRAALRDDCLVLRGGHWAAELRGVFESQHVLLVELDVAGRDVLLEMPDRARTRNHQDPLGMVQQPR